MDKKSKLQRIIKQIGFMIILSVGIVSTVHMHAQEASISMDTSNKTIAEVLENIENQTDFQFFYNSKLIDMKRRVAVKIDARDIFTALNQLFAGTDIQYKIAGKDIILTSFSAPLNAISTTQGNRKITGTVVDENGVPIIGANVLLKGTSGVGTITDSEGKFNLQVSEQSILKISYIGYLPKEIAVEDQLVLHIILTEDTKLLDEVVVVGYGVQKKKDLTGAVTALQGETIASRRTPQLSSALQGAIAGLLVTRDNNAPGTTSETIRIRGVTTIGDNSPLVIIDGVPGDLNQVNPTDVESISVLKDAASASIYGSRAAAGVILINTLRAKEHDLNCEYHVEYGWEIPTKQPEYVGIQRFLEMTNELRYNDNQAGGWFQTYSEDQVNNWLKYHVNDPNNYPNTNWTNLILHKSAPRRTHRISMTGGSKSIRTKASFTYDKMEGLYADRYYERFMMRVNNDFKINRYLEATLDFNFTRSKTHQPTFDPFDRMRIAPPVYAAVWDDGRIAEGKSGANAYGRMVAGGNRDEWYNQIGGKVSIDLMPIDGLKISGIIAPVYHFDKVKNFNKAVPYTLANDPNTIGGYLEGQATTKLTEERNDDYNVTIQGIANYRKIFGRHSLNIMAGYETFYSFNERLMASRDQYELSNFPYLDLGPLSMRDNSGNASEIAYRSWFGRTIYNYENRYLFQINIRYDGSSRFHKAYRWGAFPSLSAGWVITEEPLAKKMNIPWLSFLKLRASWGTLGNERIGNYPYQASIAFSNVLFYQNGEPISQLSAAQHTYAIQNISWEKTESFDFGMDASFFNNRLRLTADYYKKTTKDMLLALEIPDFVGFDNPQKNTGKMYTNGYEIEIGWNNQIRDWNYGLSLNFADFVSRMGSLGGTEFLGSQVKKEGSQFNEWYGYVNDGLYLTQQDVDNSAKIHQNVKVGDVKYKDISGPDGIPDGKISSEYDRKLLGGSLPRYMFGGNIYARYKDVDLSLTFQGIGSQLVRMHTTMVQPLRENYGNIPAFLDENYWSSRQDNPTNAAARYPRLTYTNASSNYTMSDFWLFNGRYIRLKNITLGYSLPKLLLKKISAHKIRIYLSANDLFCISQFPQGWDPEMGMSSYPITTSFLLGTSIYF